MPFPPHRPAAIPAAFLLSGCGAGANSKDQLGNNSCSKAGVPVQVIGTRSVRYRDRGTSSGT